MTEAQIYGLLLSAVEVCKAFWRLRSEGIGNSYDKAVLQNVNSKPIQLQ